MQSNEIRKRFLTFFEKRGHAIIPSASLITPDEKGVTNATLFNTAGMQPLVPYLLGKDHPQGKRLVDSQKCIRTVDIDEVGDNTHATFFEMLGNWSLGDYFKEEAIEWSYTFLTDPEEGLGLDPSRLYVTVFEGDENAPRDEEAASIWKKYVPENRIYYLGADDNWWSAGDNGPCGPDTEMFYDLTRSGLGDMTREEFIEANDTQKVVEVWNNVFMEYEKRDGKVVGKLPAKNVDTGAGLERFTAVLQGKESIFDTDLFEPLLEITRTISDTTASQRIIADHIKAATFLIADGAEPSNTDRGYILRRLIRRAVFLTHDRSLSDETITKLIDTLSAMYGDFYPEITAKRDHIIQTLSQENQKFTQALKGGLKEFEKLAVADIKSEDAFKLFATFGFPIELTEELAKEKGISVDTDGFKKAFEQHQEESRKGAEQKFKGGLASHGEMETKYHTATHLLHAALRTVLGEHVFQKGSNITADRLRFDFSHPDKMTNEEKKQVEDMVNAQIDAQLPVTQKDMSYDEAKKLGAMGLFEDKYGDTVSVYSIGEGDSVISRELCGGPHVTNTKELGHFKIKKEEASSAGVRRIKAVFE